MHDNAHAVPTGRLRRALPLLLTIAVLVLVVAGSRYLILGRGGADAGPPRDCSALFPDVLAMSREDGRAGIESAARMTEHLRTEDSLVCRASAQWQDGTYTGLEYY